METKKPEKDYLANAVAITGKGNDIFIKYLNDGLITHGEFVNKCLQDNHDIEYNKVIEELTKALSIEPNYEDALRFRGIIYIAQGEYNMAIKDFSKLINLSPDFNSYYFYRGFCYFQQDDYNSAIKDFDKAIQLWPDYYEYYIYRGNAVYKNNGNLTDVEKDYEKAIEFYSKGEYDEDGTLDRTDSKLFLYQPA